MPHHRHAGDDRHSFAPASRFLDEGAMAALQLVELNPVRPQIPVVTATAVTVDLTSLWQ
jgi:hypothetical protein